MREAIWLFVLFIYFIHDLYLILLTKYPIYMKKMFFIAAH